MPVYFKNLKKAFPCIRGMWSDARKQRVFTQKLLQPFFERFETKNDESLQKKDIRRMKDYPYLFTVFFNDIFCILRNKALTETERKRITCFAAFLCLYDDFFDENSLTEVQLRTMFLEPASVKIRSLKLKFCVELLTMLYENINQRHLFEEVFEKFFQAQVESKKQLSQNPLSKDEIRKISFEKGGNALLLSRLLMNNPLKEGETEAVLQIGAWLQLLDDILDINKDRKNGIQTLVTTAVDISELESELNEQSQKVFAMVQQLAYPKKSIEKAVFRFFVTGTSGWIHLEHIKKLQLKTEGKFVIQNYEEEEIEWVESKLLNIFRGLRIILSRKY